MPDYIPSTQNGLLAFALNAATLLMGSPFKFGITPAEATTFNGAVQDYKTKMDTVNNPDTKTKGAVQAKNESKLMMLYIIRPLLQYIKDNAGVASEDKVALGLNPGTSKPMPVPPPSSQPVLIVMALATRQHTITYHDMTTPRRRGKPAGVMAIELFCQVGDTPGPDPESAKLIGVATRQPFVVSYGVGDVGKTVRYWARWINTKGVAGPWSQVVVKTVSE